MALLSVTAFANVRPAPAQGAEYDLVVVMTGVIPEATQVAASYAHPVGHAALREAIARFAGETGRPVRELVMQEAPLFRGSKTISTAVQFTSPGLMMSGAPLPVAAVVQCFPGWQHLRIAFNTGQGFRFAGPYGDTVIDGRRARLIIGTSSYEYDVEKVSEGPAVAPAAASPSACTPPPARQAGTLFGGIMGAVVVVALATLAAVRLRARGPRQGK